MSDTIAAISTGSQVCAIGVVRLSGPDAIALVDRLFTPLRGAPMSARPSRLLVYGRLCSLQGDLLDLCLCTVSRAPASYTGEDTAELQCHGSPVLLRAVMEELFKLGARQAGPGEFTRRAFLNGRLELTEAEAVADIIDAETPELVVNAAAQLGGAVSARIEQVYSLLTDISSHYHAVLDYPDEDIEDFRLEQYRSSLLRSVSDLRALLDTFDRGCLMRDGIPTAIVGRPNVGKSSLLNALLGYERAIVTDVPGTTRDTIEEKLRIGPLSLRLCDTAGIHDTDDVVEQLGVERSRRALESARLVLAVIDGSAPMTAEDKAVLAAAGRCERAVVVLSKSDLAPAVAAPATDLPCVRVSAVTLDGIRELESVISALFPLPEVPAGHIITNLRQAEAIRRALDSLSAAFEAMDLGSTPDIVLTETEAAMSALGELSGRTVREDITDRIFSRFCVGK